MLTLPQFLIHFIVVDVPGLYLTPYKGNEAAFALMVVVRAHYLHILQEAPNGQHEPPFVEDAETTLMDSKTDCLCNWIKWIEAPRHEAIGLYTK